MDRLRHDIDNGRTGDKVAFPDPAAAPLGTDDEAGGSAPAPAQPTLDAPLPQTRAERARDASGVAIYCVAAGAVAAAILGIVAAAG